MPCVGAPQPLGETKQVEADEQLARRLQRAEVKAAKANASKAKASGSKGKAGDSAAPAADAPVVVAAAAPSSDSKK